MKNKRFWPEQIEEARTLAVQEKKFLTREYDAVLDADGLRVKRAAPDHKNRRFRLCSIRLVKRSVEVVLPAVWWIGISTMRHFP